LLLQFDVLKTICIFLIFISPFSWCVACGCDSRAQCAALERELEPLRGAHVPRLLDSDDDDEVDGDRVNAAATLAEKLRADVPALLERVRASSID